MLYDEANVLIDDLFILKQHIVSGDEIEFNGHLVIVEDALDAIYSDISSLYVRNQKRREKGAEKPLKTQYLKKQAQFDSSSINTLHTPSKVTKTHKVREKRINRSSNTLI